MYRCISCACERKSHDLINVAGATTVHGGLVPPTSEFGAGPGERIGNAGKFDRGSSAKLLVQACCCGSQDCGPLGLALEESQICQKP